MLPALFNHVWQSTVFAAAAGLLTLALRKNRAQVRYCLWLAASLKFLVPFSILVMLGAHFGWRAAVVTTPSRVPALIAPFEQTVPTAAAPVVQHTAVASSGSTVPTMLYTMWTIGFLTLAGSWWLRLRKVRVAVRAASPLHLPIGVRVLSSPEFIGPGVFGILRPILLLPEGIQDQLTAPQLRAIVAHELCHIRRRDNLATALHMLVEAVFWFHPPVWWLGARLMQERENACDEDVLRLGNDPEAYAEGILKICELYLESPLACVAGVTGANLKQRIDAIMSNRIASTLSVAKKAALATAGIAAIAVPIAIGVLNAPAIRAQQSQPRPSFEVASVKPIDRETMHRDHEGHLLDADRFVDRTDLMTYIVEAYVPGGSCTIKVAVGQDCPLISLSRTVPAWVRTDRFEIQAKLPPNFPIYTERQKRSGDTPQLNLMLQVLLEDRFHLQVHRETRELPVYALTVGKNGPKFKPTPPGGDQLKITDGNLVEFHGLVGMLNVPSQNGAPRQRLSFQASSMAEAAEGFGRYVDRPVLDQTGLKEDYDFAIEYDVDQTASAPPSVDKSSGLGGNLPNPFAGLTPAALSSALQDVGLRLESTKAPVEVLVIERVEKPSGN
jgi:bla regulator protein BlaR1